MILVGINIRGEELYGKIERLDGTCVVTEFKHVWALPIWPRGSYVIDEKSPERGIAIGNHARSVLVG